MSTVLVNEAYAGQRVTGQQRYALEIASRLRAHGGYRPVRPTGFWARSKVRAWLWVLLRLPLVRPGAPLLSLTARAPLWRRRHVLVVHDLFVLNHPEWFSRRYIWTHAPLLRIQLRRATAVIAVSRPVADEVERMRRTPVPVAPNAPSEIFREAGEELPAAVRGHDLTPGAYLLVVGSRDPRKNLARLAEAYGLLDAELRRRHPLVVVGGGNAIFRDTGTVWPEGTVDVGYVDDEELARLYRHARSVVFVSVAEGFGLPIVEAAAAGTRGVVVSDIAVFRWICGDRARYVDPLSVGSIAEGLRAELTDGPRAAAPDADRFSWDDSAKVIDEMCRRVAGANDGGTAGRG
ncbi:glycosyltransferase family 4 protein [Pseudonocardia alni]|uniref:glycosyltransferase family 4 protein n=1 Tax=Pseudonocardia alni TaxID=33907 RepID=UPI0027A0A9CB|nr:glycosyltransferase family 4 protein [Pseudonocardia alni]